MIQNQKQTRIKDLVKNDPAPWFSTNELLEYLGISQSELDEQSTLFTEGVHYKRAKPNQPESQMLWRIDLVDELLCLPVAPLEKEAMIKAINNDITCN